MSPAYPFPGCCDHSSNAHTRDHCLACNCTRPATQIQQPPPNEPAEADTLVDILGPCKATGPLAPCHALVLDEDRACHQEWHDKLAADLWQLTEALRDQPPNRNGTPSPDRTPHDELPSL